MTNFNLVDEPWINVAGHPRQSLRSFFENSLFRNFGGNAVEKIAMLRFMLALAHAAVELRDDEAWKALTLPELSGKILAYLEDHHDQFDLFGDRPFLQFPQLAGRSQKPLSCSALNPFVAVGNKAVLTNWNLAPEIKTEEFPLLLLQGCGCGFGGKKYDNSIVLSPGYTGKLNDKGKERSGAAGVLIGFQGYLHAYLRGETLLETIKLNMLTLEDVEKTKAFSGIGRPAWENMPDGEVSDRANEYKNSYQGILLPLDKFSLLLPEEKKMIRTDGIDYPNHLSGLADPALTIHDGRNGKKEVVWVKTQSRPWRELPSILSFIEAAEEKKTPLTLACGIRKLPLEALVHVWTAGVQVSSNAGEQFISGKDDYIESDFTFPNKNIDGFCYTRFVKTMKALDDCAKTLYGSVAGYCRELNDLSAADTAAHAVAVFWEMAEKDAQRIIDAVFSDDSADHCDVPPELLAGWRRLVTDQYSRSCSRSTARQLLTWSQWKPFARPAAKKSSKKTESDKKTAQSDVPGKKRR